MNEIANISDQIDAYAEEIISKAKATALKYDISLEDTLKVYEIANESMRNDVLWKRTRELVKVVEDLQNSIDLMSNKEFE